MVHNSTIFDSITVCEVCSDVEVRNRIKIYTDGSVYNGPLGYGACDAVLIPACDTDEIHTETNSFESEVSGVVLGIKICFDYCEKYSSVEELDTVYIFCDSHVAIDAVDRCSSNIRPDNLISLMNLRKLLHQINVSIKLVKVKGHSDMKGNLMADQWAKNTAFSMFKGNIPTPGMSYYCQRGL